jgi:predicted DCC family thiol-disulfide oxidoreductase YuxK
MIEALAPLPNSPTLPVLLFDDECAVCRQIASWVKSSAQTKLGETTLSVQPIGEDPQVLERLSPGLSIWSAYATIHVVMPDGQLKLGGEAVAEVFRNLPKTRALARSFSLNIFGFRPFQKIVDICYVILADVRPIFGCESCGAPKFWVKPIHQTVTWFARVFRIGTPKPRPQTPVPTNSVRLR